MSEAARNDEPTPIRRRPLSQGQIEDLIVDLSTRLENETDRYSTVCDEVAETEANWKFGFHTALVDLADTAEKMSVSMREARAHLKAGKDLYRLYRLAQERQRATAALLTTLRTRLEAMRTLAANVRAQT